ncbi:MAG: endonuclease MutS2 [Oscillospiraceae bacterium]|nr:endonuclease MutS2 [Oscillospiraceae bacterium]
MDINSKTYKRLEFDKVLSILSHFAVSDEAKEMILDIVPCRYLVDAQKMLSMTDCVVSMYSKNSSLALISEDGVVPIIQRAEKGSTLSMGELLHVKRSLQNGRLLKKWYNPDSEKASNTDELFFNLFEDVRLENDIASSIISESEMADDASSTLASIRKKIIRQESNIREKLDSIIRSQSSSKYLQDAIVTMRGGRFVVPVKVENKTAIPGLVHDVSSSGNTLFIEPNVVVEANNAIMRLKAEEQLEIDRILAAFSARVSSSAKQMIRGHNCFVQIDVLLAKARYAIENDAAIPSLNSEGYIHIVNGRHPLIDKKKVVPINLNLGSDYNALIITGPNTGGKTVTLKTVGLLTLMIASGIPVPASQNSDLSIFYNVLADLGDEQSIEQNLSTFSSHIANISSVLDEASDRSLVLLDELGSGTDPAEGAALAEAVLEELISIGCKTIATSHYGEVKMFALETEGVENASCDFDIETLTPTYKLNMGIPGQSNALLICQRLGLNQEIINSAKNKMNASNRRFEEVVARLDQMNRQLQIEKEKVNEIKLDAERELKEAKIEAERILSESKKENERLINKSRQLSADVAAQASRLIDEMRAMDRSDSSQRKNNISRAKQILNRDSLDLVENNNDAQTNYIDLPPVENVKKGDIVYVVSLGSNASVLSNPDRAGNVSIQSGAVRMKVNISALRSAVTEKPGKKEYTYSPGKKEDDSGKKTEVDVRGKTVDEAIPEIEIVFDRARLSHIHFISIIHGKGTGALRKGIHNWLKHLTYIKSFRLGEFGEGDAGVTIVELK